MARYNKIFAGPTFENRPQTTELQASATILPGCAIVVSSGKFALAGASTVGKVWVAQDNYLTMKTVDNAYASDDVCIGLELLPDQLYNVLLATSNDVKRGDALTTAANGLWTKSAAGKQVHAYADEDYNNATGSSQLIRVRPAVGYQANPSA